MITSGTETVILNVVRIVIDLYGLLIFIRVILSWIPVNSPALRPVLKFIYDVTEPYLALFRRFIPGVVMGGVDFSPIIAILVLQYLVGPLFTKLVGLVFQ